VDIAYMSTTGSTSAASVRGMSVSPAGAMTSDTSLWTSDDRFFGAITWDPDGSSLAWEQMTSSKGKRYRDLVVGSPGGAVRTIWRFLPGDPLKPQNGTDKLAWGRGCNGKSVIVFTSTDSSASGLRLYEIDPNAAAPTPQLLHVMNPSRPDPEPLMRPSLGSGLAFSPLGGHLLFADYSLELGRDALVALPLTCAAGSPLPVAAGDPQPLFAIEYDGGAAWLNSLDWSSDGKRIAVAMGPYEALVGMAHLYDTRIWVGELNYSSADGTEQVTAASTAMYRITSGPADASADVFPSWARSPDNAACDRLAYAKGGGILLLDVPREGFSAADCTIAAPKAIGGQSAAALDWK
jgi:WD40 repeat protein